MISKTLFVLVLCVYLSCAACDSNLTPVQPSPDDGSLFDGPTEPTKSGFRKDYTYEAETDTYYKEHTTSENWHEAIAACKAEGAQLAVPLTKIEADMVTKHFSGRTYLTWLGIHDLFAEGKFITLNGTRVADIYVDWVEGEPNNFGGNENCLGMTKEGKYNDVPCDSFVSTFVCTKRRSEVVRNDECEAFNEGCDTNLTSSPDDTSHSLIDGTTEPIEPTNSGFRKDYTYEAETDTYYKEHTTSKNWHEAIAACKAEGAQLAVPLTKTEADMVTKHFSGRTYLTWLGINDLFVEGKFKTLNGTRVEDIYINWVEGEPNNLGGNENCLGMTKEGKYNDVPCDSFVSTFVCTKRRYEVVRNSECDTFNEGYFVDPEVSVLQRCYKIHTIPVSWYDAYDICDNEEASLAMANSEEEANLFIKFLARYPESSLKGNFNKEVIFLDFNDLITQGEFMTSKGQTLEQAGWSAWREGQPDNAGGQERCGTMRRDGKLSHLNCDDKALFICEKAAA